MYREAELIELCVVCKDEAAGRCERCGIPVCSRHIGDEKNRCSECETEYLFVEHGVVNKFSIAALTVTVTCALFLAMSAGAFAGSLTYPAILNWLLAAPFGAWVLRLIAPKFARAKFLREETAGKKALDAAAKAKELEAGESGDVKLLPESTEPR